MALKIVRRYDANGRELTEKDLETFRLDGMKHPSDELEGLYLAREDEQICLLYYQVFVGMLEINITSAEVLYKQKEEIINE